GPSHDCHDRGDRVGSARRSGTWCCRAERCIAAPESLIVRGAQRVAEQSGFVLHTYPYSETSLVVEAFTREHGRVPLVAKGAKRPRSAWRGVLMPFQPLSLSWSGSGEVKTLGGAAGAARRPP